jgi:tripartite-type tricarboxylate transporter receptor subunit TctC
MRGWGVLVGALAMLAGGAAAQERAIQVVNPYAAGSTTDLLARALVPGLQARLGVPVLVVNREGAAGGIGTASVARAAPDGTTLLFAPAVVLSVMPALRRDAGYTAEGFTPVCQTFENAMVLAVREDSPWTGLAALVAAEGATWRTALRPPGHRQCAARLEKDVADKARLLARIDMQR